MSSFIDRLKGRMTGSLAKPLKRAIPTKRSRHTVATNIFDEEVWQKARKTEVVDGLINDLMTGDKHRGGTREPFEYGPELAHDLFMSLYKAAPRVLNRRQVEREAYPVLKIIQELNDNPRLIDLQEVTSSDAAMSTIGLRAMSGTVLEIIGRVPPPPPPPGDGPGQPGGQPGEGEGQGQQPTAPNGPGGHPGDDPNGNNQQGQGQQPAPEGGQPQGPGNTPAPSNGGDGGDEDGDGQDGGQAPSEFDPDSEGDAEDQAETDWENDFDNLLDDLDIDRAMNRALDEAAQEAEELDNMRRGIGLEDGEWRLMSPEQRLAMAERLSSSFISGVERRSA